MFALNSFQMCLPWVLSCQGLMAGSMCWVGLCRERLSCQQTGLDPTDQNSNVQFPNNLLAELLTAFLRGKRYTHCFFHFTWLQLELRSGLKDVVACRDRPGPQPKSADSNSWAFLIVFWLKEDGILGRRAREPERHL